MGTEKDIAKELMGARADLKDALGLALGAYGELIMSKVDRLITLETDCVRRDRRVEALAERKHEVLVREAKKTAAALRAEARAVRGEEPEAPPRTCASCHRSVPEVEFYQNRKHPEKIRYHCKDCEKKTTRDNVERRRKEAEAAGEPWPQPRQRVTVTAGKLRTQAKPQAEAPVKQVRHLSLISSPSA